ncbi:MAG TPA: magnesium transporter [Bacteroidota bacterium]|nr:magnesium transporter [Bacteroidota bacterium]
MTQDARDIDQTIITEDAIIIPRKRGVKTFEVDDELMQDIQELARDKAGPLLLNIIAEMHAADIGVIVNRLEGDERHFVFDLLQPEVASTVLLELDPPVREALLENLPSEKITAYVSLLASDDATDLVAELPPHIADKVLRAMPVEESTDVKELMKYDPETAGGIMGTEFVAVQMNDTVAQSIKAVRTMAKNNMVIYTVYVVDEEGLLVGVLPLQSLVLHAPNRRVYKIMDSDAKSVSVDVDQEEAAAMFRKYDLVALPVVDKAGKLVGRITIDDIVDVIEAEHTEDVAKMVGSDADELEKRSPYQIAWLRLPWVLTTLAIEFGAGIVIHAFDATLSRVILLASFMPIISAISGNTGLQSAAIIVRAMATGHVTLDNWWKPVWRQLHTTFIIGGACGIVIGVVGALWQGRWEFGLVVGTAMFVSVNLSGAVGTTVPMISKHLGFDPALTAGPFETAFQDVVGISIFLAFATMMLQFIA